MTPPAHTAPAATAEGGGASATPLGLVTKRGAATVLFTDPGGRLLIVDPTYKPGWELPGGAIEAHESPAQAATREVDEELGLGCHTTTLLAVDYVPAHGARTEAMITVFDGGTLPNLTGVVLNREELHQAAFVHPDALHHYLPALQTRRARAALAARAAQRSIYLEDGHPLN